MDLLFLINVNYKDEKNYYRKNEQFKKRLFLSQDIYQNCRLKMLRLSLMATKLFSGAGKSNVL